MSISFFMFSPQRALALGVALLVALILAGNVLLLRDLRERSLLQTEATLARQSLTLAEQADRSFKALDLVLASMEEQILGSGVIDSLSYEISMHSLETHNLLKEKLSGLPQVDAITMINADGKLINFSRYWPIPDVNVSDRDYFKALKADAAMKSFISAPVQNRGTGTWTIYMARRISNYNNEFVGLVLGAMTLRYFEDFYAATASGSGSAISLIRDDGALLVRYPHTADIGKIFTNVPRALGALKSGVVRELSPIDFAMRIKSAHFLSNFPMFVLVTQTEASALAEWRQLAFMFSATAAGCILVILVAAFAVARWWKQQASYVHAAREKAEAEKARALAESELLREREKSAEAASRAKSSFLAVMSHEIRTPMNAVLGLATVLLGTRLDAEQRATVAAINDAGEGLLEILNDILEHSKLEAGELALEQIAFAPQSIIDSTLTIIGPRATGKGLKVRVLVDRAVPRALSGDAGRLRQVLLNLVSNAVKFTPSGGISISARCLKMNPGAATVEWSVSDSGIGIPPERIAMLFKDFVQADCTINRRFGGSGLGLSICRRIVEQMGGEIDVVSTPGQGTTVRFSVTLPIADSVAPAEPHDEGANGRLRAAIAALGRPLRVLIVDDNPTNRLVAVKMLQEFDVQSSVACDGAEAVAAASQFAYDVILMDVRMPEMDGLEATRRLRARPATASSPIIAFTANAFPEDVEACLSAGMNDFIVKPVRQAVLVEKLNQVMRTHPGTAAPAPGGDPGLLDVASASTSTDRPDLDRKALRQLEGEIGATAAAEAVRMFLEETGARLVNARSLPCDTNRVVIAREAHTIKGTAGTFGLVRLAVLAADLEARAMSLDQTAYLHEITRLETAFADARQELLQHLPVAA